MTDTTILDKVRKLLRLAGNNPNAEEAASAAAKAQGMIDAHKLSAAMLELDEPARAVPDEPVADYGAEPLGDFGRDGGARVRLASTIARANACRIYMRNGRSICLVGRASDCETVRYLYAWLVGEMERLADRHGHGLGRVYRANFKLGVVDTLHRRLRATRDADTATARETARATGNPGAMVRLDMALANLETRAATVDTWMKSNMRLTAGRVSGGRFHSGARDAGRAAGESIRLSGGARLGSGAARLRA
jgi:hypothetical protein